MLAGGALDPETGVISLQSGLNTRVLDVRAQLVGRRKPLPRIEQSLSGIALDNDQVMW